MHLPVSQARADSFPSVSHVSCAQKAVFSFRFFLSFFNFPSVSPVSCAQKAVAREVLHPKWLPVRASIFYWQFTGLQQLVRRFRCAGMALPQDAMLALPLLGVCVCIVGAFAFERGKMEEKGGLKRLERGREGERVGSCISVC